MPPPLQLMRQLKVMKDAEDSLNNFHTQGRSQADANRRLEALRGRSLIPPRV